MNSIHCLALIAFIGTAVYASPAGKAIGIFNVVKFPNDVCNTGGTMNGTCYTAEECDNRDGVATGTCADGFGVCCVISLACGATTSENCTYLNLATTGTAEMGCSYTICPASTSVSRIKLDLTSFQIAAPTAPVDQTGAAAGVTTEGGAQGQCNMDTFQVTGGSGGSSPVICGVNTGQHLFVDTDGSQCVTAAFSFGGDSSTRSYNIHVIQYDALNEFGGPAGCLQYYTGATGTVNTFNWQGLADISQNVHLASQNYDVCVRRLADRCAICWSPITTGNVIGSITGSFGLSVSAIDGASMEESEVGATCTADHIVIPNGLTGTAATVTTGLTVNSAAVAAAMIGNQRFCGRFLAGAVAMADGTVCSRVTPFKLSVFTDATEAVAAAGANMQSMSDSSGTANAGPFGTMGFSLGFSQIAC